MERNEIYDFYKAVLMFGVVWGHAITGFGGVEAFCNITWFLRLYDMPFFMLISGFFLKYSVEKYHMGELLINKITTILVPTILWGILLSRRITVFSGYYFLFAVFYSSIVLILVEKLLNKDSFKWLKCVCYFALVLGLYLIDGKPYNLCYLFPFFLLGYKNNTWYRHKMFWFVVLLIGLCFWKKTYSIWNSDTNVLHGYKILLLNIYRLVIGCAAVATMRVVFDMAYMYFKANHSMATSLISNSIGRETLGLYVSHVFVINIMKHSIRFIETKYGFNPFILNERLLVFFITPAFSIITLFLCYKLIKLCKMNRYLKFLWGFKVKFVS